MNLNLILINSLDACTAITILPYKVSFFISSLFDFLPICEFIISLFAYSFMCCLFICLHIYVYLFACFYLSIYIRPLKELAKVFYDFLFVYLHVQYLCLFTCSFVLFLVFLKSVSYAV